MTKICCTGSSSPPPPPPPDPDPGRNGSAAAPAPVALAEDFVDCCVEEREVLISMIMEVRLVEREESCESRDSAREYLSGIM